MAKGNGIERKGKTAGKQLGITGANVGIDNGKKSSGGKKGGKTNEAMLKDGFNKAKYAANGKSV